MRPAAGLAAWGTQLPGAGWVAPAGAALGTSSLWTSGADRGCCCCCCSRAQLRLCPHGLQHPSLPCPSLSPRARSNSCPLSRWCHPTISSSVTLFSSCPQSFSVSGSFPMSWLFVSSGQSIGASAAASVLPMNIQTWFPLGWTGWSPCSLRDSQESSPDRGWGESSLPGGGSGRLSCLPTLRQLPSIFRFWVPGGRRRGLTASWCEVVSE